MKKEVQDALETAIASFEKRQDAEQQRSRERERFEAEWTKVRAAVVVPALEEIKALLAKACWHCDVRPDKDQGVHFTIYRENMKAGIGAGGSERPYELPAGKRKKHRVGLRGDDRIWCRPGQLCSGPNHRRVCPGRSVGVLCAPCLRNLGATTIYRGGAVVTFEGLRCKFLVTQNARMLTARR